MQVTHPAPCGFRRLSVPESGSERHGEAGGMSAELHLDDGAAPLPVEPGTDPAAGPGERRRPNVSGALPTILQAAPMFRRVVVGYDRFQVDTYVRWAEDELAAADHEHEHLLA